MVALRSQVRVFISSTFVDMQEERDILNQDVFPIVKGVCDKLGVAFNMIDLRWGITDEDKANGSVLELCLDEIQHCKPYFIGLIGNHYGTILSDYSSDIEEKYGFIKANKDKSVTEMEMILGALSEENRERCFFYYKDPGLFVESHNDGHEEAIEDLKKRIDDLNIYHTKYADFNSFKDTVLKDLVEAIKADYPEGTDIVEVRQQAYINLHESNYIERASWEEQVSDVITYAEEHHVAIAVITPFPAGKTSTFNHLINERKNADKIVINFEADVNMRFFPAHYLYNMISNGLYDYGYDIPEFEDYPEPEFLNNYESSILCMLSVLKKTLLSIEYKRPLYILINDANLFFWKDRSKSFRHAFLFDMTTLPNNLNVIITTNDMPETDMVCIQMNPSITTKSAKNFLVNYLFKFGKNLDTDILNDATPRLHFYEYKIAAKYLVLYCNYTSYKNAARELLTKQNYTEMLLYIFNRFISEMSIKCASVLTEILLRLFFYEPGLSERALFASYNKETALENTEYQVYVDLTGIEKASIMRALRYFSNTDSGVVFISDSLVRSFIGNNIDYFTDVLYKNNSERTRKAYEDNFSRYSTVTHIISGNQVLTKNEFLNDVASGKGSTRIMQYAVFDPLCISLDAIITEYTQELKSDENAYNAEDLTDREIKILVTIQEAADLYKFNTRTDLYAKILGNVELMLFVCCKSHALLKRLITGYIDLNVHIHETQFSHVDKKAISFALDYEIKNIMNADKERFSKTLIEDVVDTAIMVLEENEMMDDDFLEIGKSKTRTYAMRDYVVNACSAEAEDRVYKIDYTCDYAETNDVAKIIPILAEYYQHTSSVFDKLLYAYYLFKAVDRLVEDNMMTNEIFEKYLYDHIGEINQLRYTCFFPEITEAIIDFLDRIEIKT